MSPSPSDATVSEDAAADPSAFFAQQARLLGAAALLLRDERQQVLLVQPRYKSVWHLPGGLMEADESPRQAARRETEEEIGLVVPVGRLLTVDYKSVTDTRPACLQFVFEGGILTAAQLEQITVQADEIAAWRLAPRELAVQLVQPGGPASRLARTLAALDTGTTAYLEDGQLSQGSSQLG
jgi:ADP-ribose pyrophosphatase YjhB (NUDIX family)